MKKTLLSLLTLLGLGSGMAMAAPLTYTSQQWSFDTRNDDNMVYTLDGQGSIVNADYVEVADSYTNSFVGPLGFEPTMTVTNVNSYTYKDTFDGHDGVWLVARDQDIQMNFAIPNNLNNTGTDTWKEITIEVVYKYEMMPEVYPDDDPYFSFNYDYDVHYNDSSIEELGNNWYKATYSIIVTPNPIWENIKIAPESCTTYIDSISIETVCLPEPATVMLVSAGSLLMMRRRR